MGAPIAGSGRYLATLYQSASFDIHWSVHSIRSYDDDAVAQQSASSISKWVHFLGLLSRRNATAVHFYRCSDSCLSMPSNQCGSHNRETGRNPPSYGDQVLEKLLHKHFEIKGIQMNDSGVLQ